MKVFISLVIILCLLTGCSQQKGCTSQFASNFNPEALIDCCCDYNMDEIFTKILGKHQISETCSGNKEEYEIEISKESGTEETIVISNFNQSGSPIKADWAEGEFAFRKNWSLVDCEKVVTGSLHLNNNKIHIIYASIPSEDCDEIRGVTCEARAN